jgi:hypothetical protein
LASQGREDQPQTLGPGRFSLKDPKYRFYKVKRQHQVLPHQKFWQQSLLHCWLLNRIFRLEKKGYGSASDFDQHVWSEHKECNTLMRNGVFSCWPLMTRRRSTTSVKDSLTAVQELLQEKLSNNATV